jgi:predicted dehydrogenase
MIKVGLLGFGFMGSTHYQIYQGISDLKVTSIFDSSPEKVKKGEITAGNIAGGDVKLDFRGVNVTDNPEDVISSDVDILDITLPTHLHKEFTIKALDRGRHVLCEKPMALTSEDCDAMLRAKEKSGKELMIAQCIRFWPEYALIKKMLDEKRYGEVISAFFKRVSPTPMWSYENWSLKEEKSGGAVIDLHIHDIDYIIYLFGKPKEVSSFGRKNICGPDSGVDYLVTKYNFDTQLLVIAEGGWHFHPQFPFNMSFIIRCKRATIWFDSAKEKTLAIFKDDGTAEYPEVAKRTGWEEEIRYFVDCIRMDKPIDLSPPEESKLALEIALAERKSIEKNTSIRI